MRGRGLEPLLFSHSELLLTFLNVRFRPEADIANVNVLQKTPHLGANRSYLKDVTAAEFCEAGGHGLKVGEAQLLSEFDEFGFF